MTDNHNRSAGEIRQLFKKGQLGGAGSNKFLFDHVGIVEAHHPDGATDLEAAAIEAGANEFEPISAEQNDDVPEGHAAARFLTERNAVHAAATWLKQHGWTVITAELGYVAKSYPDLDDAARAEVGEFLQALEDNDDVQRVWAAVK
jgi:transcriptional/translational regulatory protein YebC/TACO1